jgi:hypothetical protein
MAESQRRYGAIALAGLMPRITGKAMRARGFAEDAIIARWVEIVGAALAADTAPDRIRFPRGRRDNGVLHLRVEGAAALEVQHEAPRIVERVNAFFGYPAISRVALVQGPLPKRPGPARKPPPAALSPADRAALESAVGGVEDEALRASLARLGRAIRGRRGKP